MPRPSKFNSSRATRITQALRAGATRKAAAAFGQIDYVTFLRWLEKGEAASSGELSEFFDAVELAEAECAMAMTATIYKAATGYKITKTRTVTIADGVPVVTVEITEGAPDWRAALEWLKRRRRADWGDAINLKSLDDETILRLLEVAHAGCVSEVE